MKKNKSGFFSNEYTVLLLLLISFASFFGSINSQQNIYGRGWCPFRGNNRSYDKPDPPQIVRYGGYNPWHLKKNQYQKWYHNGNIGHWSQWYSMMKLGAHVRVDDQGYWNDVRILDAYINFYRYNHHRYDQILRLRIHRGWLQYIWAATWRRTGSVWDTWSTFDVAYPRYWWEMARRWGYTGRHRFHYGRRHHWHSIYWIHMDQWRRRWMNFKILINTGHWWVPSISYPWGGKYHWCASRVVVSVNKDQWVALGCNGWTQ